jgi:DNA-binding PadR family transcriptional regulator
MGIKEPRLTQQTLAVLGALVQVRELSGVEIAKVSNLASGTLYPILYRLEEVGWLVSRWEEGSPELLGRPRRRYYRITGEGQRRVKQVINDLSPGRAGLAWEF